MPVSTVSLSESQLMRDKDRTSQGNLSAHILVTEIKDAESVDAKWHEIIDRKLIEWGRSVSDFEIEGLEAPSYGAISAAYRLLAYMRGADFFLPTGVIPDGEGGIVFENRRNAFYQRIEISDCGEMTLKTFENSKLVDQCQISIS